MTMHTRTHGDKVRALLTLPKHVQQHLQAQMALVGFRFPPSGVHPDHFNIATPIGELYIFNCPTIEEAGLHAWLMWHDKGQAMWTGRAREDFDDCSGEERAQEIALRAGDAPQLEFHQSGKVWSLDVRAEGMVR